MHLENSNCLPPGSKVFITGIAGYIGAYLARHVLQQNAKVYGIVRPTTNLDRIQDIVSKIHLISCDICDLQAMRTHLQTIQPDYIYHLATTRQEDWASLIETNLVATMNILGTAATLPVQRVVLCGTMREYGTQAYALESDVLAPWSLYGASKAAMSLFAEQQARAQQLPVVVLRLFYVYGYDEPAKRLIPTILRAINKQQLLRLTSESVKRDYVFMDDVIDAFILASTTDTNGKVVFNIGYGEQHNAQAVVKAIEDILQTSISRSADVFPVRDWDRDHWVAEITRAKDILGWQPQYSLYAGLRKSIEWMKQNDAPPF